MTEDRTVTSALAGGILRLTLANPPANALSIEVMNRLQSGLDGAIADPGVRVVIIAASGRLFSGGHDLKEMTAHRGDPDRGRAFFEQTFETCSTLMRTIAESPKPIIAEVDGIATAAGCQLVASCDLAFASDRARFAVNGIDVGLFCSTPAVALTRAVLPKRAMEMLLTGEMIDAETALDIGLVNRVVPAGALRAEVDRCAEIISAKSPFAVALGKRAVREQAPLGLADAYATATRAIVENMLAPNAEEGIAAFFEQRSRTKSR